MTIHKATRSHARRSVVVRVSLEPRRRPTVNRPSAGISRIDQPTRRTHGYVVRLDYRNTAGGYRPRVSAFFADKSFGGRHAAWKAAEAFMRIERRRRRR